MSRGMVDAAIANCFYGKGISFRVARALYEIGMCHHSLHLPEGELGSCPPSGADLARQAESLVSDPLSTMSSSTGWSTRS